MPDSPHIVKGVIGILSLIFLFSSCNSDKQGSADVMPPLYAAPQTIAVNTEPGYEINPITGDSIQPIINSLGDTLKTGVPLQITGYSLDSGIPEKPRILPARSPKVVPIARNVHKIPEELTIIPVNRDSLHSFTSDKDIMFPFILVNSTGDTIPSGVPLPIKGRVVPCLMPLPVKALMPRIKDNTTVNMKYLDVDQGMNSSNVSSIMEDSRGNLWIGTSGGGVSRYNGESFTHFTEKEGLCSNIVISILEDRNGNLWFGTSRGACMYDGKNFTHFTEKEGLGNNYIRSMVEDRNGNLWFGTWGGGLIKYDGKTITHFTSNEGFNAANIFSMVEDAHGNIWVGALGGVFMYDGTAFTYFGEKEGLICLIVWCVMEDSRGNLWFGTNDGLSKYNGPSFTNYTEKEGLSREACHFYAGRLPWQSMVWLHGRRSEHV